AIAQAGVAPNPMLVVEAENLAGSGPYGFLDRTETTLNYQQTWERGGKREARVALAERGRDAVQARALVRGLDLLAQVQKAYVEAAAAGAEAALARERLALAERVLAEVDRRVRSARDPLFAGARAQASVEEARIELRNAEAERESAHRTLASYWDGAAALELDPRALEVLASPAGPVEGVADLRLLAAERDTATARVRVERARAVQDPAWTLGLRYFREGGDVAAVAGFSLPIGRSEGYRAGLDQAQAERLAAEREIVAARLERAREAQRLSAHMASSRAEAQDVEARLIPQAERAVALVRDGFNRGGFSYIDVIEAQRALAQARERRLAALKAYHLDEAALDRLNGAHADIWTAVETRP
ncbi:MAG: TolC family protein, partial [Phenylobacterium sp.]|uniref:TolC family protein n=1 Tax=Phenylobacterium sp. TaxID=1871053 RepID=UPI00273548BD